MSASRKLLLGALCCVGAGVFAGSFTEPNAKLRFLAVGQGDSAVFQQGGTAVLIDTGPGGNGFDSGERLILPKLRESGVTDVSLILLSHPDSDHVSGTGAILKKFPRAILVISSAFQGHRDLRERLQEWKVDPESVLWVGPKAKVEMGRFTLDILCPPLIPGEADNAGSMIVKIEGEGASAVLTGDAPEEVERIAAATGEWDAQVLKAGHHGSKSSTCTTWLREVRPAHVIVSCGRDNMYGHPNGDMIQRTQKFGSTIHRTDQEGDVVFTARSGRFETDHEH